MKRHVYEKTSDAKSYCVGMKDVRYDTIYLRFWGLMRYLLVTEIIGTPNNTEFEILAEDFFF